MIFYNFAKFTEIKRAGFNFASFINMRTQMRSDKQNVSRIQDFWLKHSLITHKYFLPFDAFCVLSTFLMRFAVREELMLPFNKFLL